MLKRAATGGVWVQHEPRSKVGLRCWLRFRGMNEYEPTKGEYITTKYNLVDLFGCLWKIFMYSAVF